MFTTTIVGSHVQHSSDLRTCPTYFDLVSYWYVSAQIVRLRKSGVLHKCIYYFVSKVNLGIPIFLKQRLGILGPKIAVSVHGQSRLGDHVTLYILAAKS